MKYRSFLVRAKLLRILFNNVVCLRNLKASDILFFFYFHKYSNYFDQLSFRENVNNALPAQSSNPNFTQLKKGQNWQLLWIFLVLI